MFAHLHTRSWFSFQAAGSSPEALPEAAIAQGVGAVALTERHGVYGVVRFQRACQELGIQHIFGAEVPVDGRDLVLLAQNREGYANICWLLTQAHLRSREEPSATLDELAEHCSDVFCLTGTEAGPLYPLIDAFQPREAAQWVHTLHDLFGERLSIEVTHQRRKGDDRRLAHLLQLARQTGVPPVATGDVRYAVPGDYWRYDLLTCARHGITVFDDHPDRPCNAMAYLQPEAELKRRGLPAAAIHRAGEIGQMCKVDLIPGHIIPPGTRLPAGKTSVEVFREHVFAAFDLKYPPGSVHREAAEERLAKEVGVISGLDVQEFFLVVHEVVEEARRRGIRCLGRGSAANSIVTYLLGITVVCPIEHNLLFERFLHRGRKGTPDIDLDFDSSRRLEIVEWMEERFGVNHTGMAATIDRYLTKSAVQDTAKALGWPAEMAIQMSKGCGYGPPDDEHNAAHIRSVAGGDSPLVETLIKASANLVGCPRHLGQHSGGMVLTRDAMRYFTPLQVSANGVRVVQFDKDDLEWLGLVKLDVLGLRMLGTVSEATVVVNDMRPADDPVVLDELPLNDPDVYDMICEGDVLGLFQIESPAQMSAGSRIQSRSMQDLIKQISLVRPGPIQGGLMHPFIRRHRGLEKVRYDHPILERILEDTYGVIIFQEQVLEVVHQFAGWDLDRADSFRRLMSKFRDPVEMESMRDGFVQSAMETNDVPEPVANRVFDQVSKFVGYGFCRSHAASFALTVYHSAYLKRHHPEAFFAGLMQHRPGMYAQMTLEQDARRHGVLVLVPDINASGLRFQLERVEGRLAIRKPLTSVKGVQETLAQVTVLEREMGAFSSIEDFFHRVPVDEKQLTALVQSGAFDLLEGSNRTALFKMKVLLEQYEEGGGTEQMTLLDTTSLRAADIPALPGITLRTRLEWDLKTHSGPRVHPMVVIRRSLRYNEIRSIEFVKQFGTTLPYDEHKPPVVTIAGLVMFRQRPGTAKGTMFLFLEDESAHIQCICRPDVRARFEEELRQSALIVKGRVQVTGPWRGIMVDEVVTLGGVIGGYKGQHGGPTYGREHRVTAFGERAERSDARVVEVRDDAG
ncbi:MAG: DNA polymerase III subunit alpha [Rhodothermales bacterium]|nr:DNA polymerase III subunit alpha [Rhodothermales bacterium]MBO6778918.1 DNA polymerase III subunit alpha [Rhodothermales bacterium]